MMTRKLYLVIKQEIYPSTDGYEVYLLGTLLSDREEAANLVADEAFKEDPNTGIVQLIELEVDSGEWEVLHIYHAES